MRYAIITDGVVAAVTLWDGQSEWTPPDGSIAVVCGDDVVTGWLYDGTAFSPPPAPPPEPVILNKVDFLRLFYQQERIDIRAASTINPVIADYQYMLDAATTVSLSDPDILTGIPLLETAGLIGPGRAAQILANEPPA